MKITSTERRKMLSYGLITTGQVFKRESTGERVFIKTDYPGQGGMAVLAINLADGAGYSWPGEADGFYLVDAEVLVDG